MNHDTTAVIVIAAAMTGGLRADDVTTSFEFLDIDGAFTLGDPPETVTFTDGLAQSVGILALYHTGFNSWMIPPGGTGTITFDTPAHEVDLWFRDQFASNESVLTFFDTGGVVLGAFEGVDAWANVTVTAPENGDPVGSATFTNNGAVGWSVIDDFTSCAVAADGGEPIEDPIPEPIPTGDVALQLEIVADGLTAPNWGTAAPGHPGRLFVVDQSGILWAVELDSGIKTAFLDVTAQLVDLGIFGEGTFDERGLLGAAFHDEYLGNGLLYTYTSEPVSGPADFSTMPDGEAADHQTVITEWQVPAPADPASVVDPGTARVLLRIDQPQFNHNAGAISFGLDGMLYIALGDGGGADDLDGQDFLGAPIIGHGDGNGKDPTNPLGAVLRIDPLGDDAANGAYGIPSDNPFLPPGAPEEFVDEIYAYGFRNPFRFSFDTATGDLWLADVGQNDLEEVDVVFSGGNYGWNHMEGSFFFDPNGNEPGFVTDVDPGVPPDLVVPVAQYDHDEGIAIIGGFVYRGARVGPLAGKYVFGEFAATFDNDGRLFYLDGTEIREFSLVGQAAFGMSLLGMGQDAAGEVYAMANLTGTPFGDTGVVLRLSLRTGDVDGDGVVGLDDLLALIDAWGPCPAAPAACGADFDGDGVVDVRDLIAMTMNWG